MDSITSESENHDIESYSNENHITETNNNKNYSIEFTLPELNNLAGWATFVAIMDIVAGALCSIGIITAVFGIPMIISGVRLLSATDEMKKYIASKDNKSIFETFVKMNQYFKVKGITIIIRITFSIVIFILYILLLIYLYNNMMPIMFNEQPFTQMPFQ